MNAKEISDATLESVTPADNDLILIYDTSEGTTGKATIAGIAPKVIDNVIKRGLVTIPESISGSYAVHKSVIFDISFDDDNYVIELTRSSYTYYADTSIVYANKTKYGFSIQEWNNNTQLIRPAHQVSWVAIKI